MSEEIKCQNCRKEFNPGDRAQPTAQKGTIVQIIYCSMKCKRQANNRKYYKKYRQEMIQRELDKRARAKGQK